MNAFTAMLGRDLRLAMRNAGDSLTFVLFFIMIGAITPFAIGPDKLVLARLAPGIVWIAAFLSALLTLDRMFRPDHEDGTLMALRHADLSFAAIAFAKLLAHWLTTALPLLLAMPLMALMLNMDMDTFWRTCLSLLVGTPALTALGAVGAAVTVSLSRGGLVASILILPMSIPVLIFGVSAITGTAGPNTSSAALLFLSGLSLLGFAFAPFAAALALRLAQE